MTLDEAIKRYTSNAEYERTHGNLQGCSDFKQLAVWLEELKQKTGHWVLSGGYWRCSECKEKALLKLDKATGGYREYEPVRSKYCPGCGAKMQEVKK